VVGDWMGSIYGVGGQRADWHLFLDHDGRYERAIRADPGSDRRDAGRWEYDEADHLLTLVPDAPEPVGRPSGGYWVLAVTTCETSNVLLVLREAVLASRNLPILLYRVRRDGRAYGTGWGATGG